MAEKEQSEEKGVRKCVKEKQVANKMLQKGGRYELKCDIWAWCQEDPGEEGEWRAEGRRLLREWGGDGKAGAQKTLSLSLAMRGRREIGRHRMEDAVFMA